MLVVKTISRNEQITHSVTHRPRTGKGAVSRLLYLGTDAVFMALISTFERLFSCMFHDDRFFVNSFRFVSED
jgi:hypothetical protein